MRDDESPRLQAYKAYAKADAFAQLSKEEFADFCWKLVFDEDVLEVTFDLHLFKINYTGPAPDTLIT